MSDKEWSKLSFETSELRSEVDSLNAEMAWLKTQMAGLMDYEAEIGDKLAKARAECDRLQGENFRLRRALGVVAGAVLKPVLSDTHLQFNVLVTFARSTLEAKP